MKFCLTHRSHVDILKKPDKIGFRIPCLIFSFVAGYNYTIMDWYHDIKLKINVLFQTGSLYLWNLLEIQQASRTEFGLDKLNNHCHQNRCSQSGCNRLNLWRMNYYGLKTYLSCIKHFRWSFDDHRSNHNTFGISFMLHTVWCRKRIFTLVLTLKCFRKFSWL